MHGSHHSHKHNVRFYIVVTTLVLGGIFLLLVANNQNNPITNAVVGVVSGDSINNTPKAQVEQNQDSANDELTAAVVRASKKGTPIDFDLIIDGEFEFKEAKTSADKIELVCPGKEVERLTLDGNVLEVGSLESVTIVITQVDGEIEQTSSGLTLDVSAEQLSIDDVALASRTQQLHVVGDSLDCEPSFSSLTIRSELAQGSGTFDIGKGELVSNFEEYDIGFDIFTGDIVLGSENTFNGIAQGVSVTSDLYSFTIK